MTEEKKYHPRKREGNKRRPMPRRWECTQPIPRALERKKEGGEKKKVFHPRIPREKTKGGHPLPSQPLINPEKPEGRDKWDFW